MGKNSIIKIKRNSIFYFIGIIPFIPITYISQIFPAWYTFCSYARIFIVIFLLWRLIFVRRNLTVPFILAIVFFITAFISTYLANANLYTLFYNSIFLFGMTLLVEDGIYFDMDAMLQGILLWFEILVYANLIYYILNPMGYMSNGHYHLFGNYNTVIRKLFPGIILGGIYAYRTKNRITFRFVCMYLSLFIYLIGVGAITACAGMAIFGIGLIWSSFFGGSGIFKFEYFIIISVALTVIFAILGSFDIFQRIITDIFGKSMTLSSRTYIWEKTLNAIQVHPILGYGQLSQSGVRQIIEAVDPHNMILGTLFYGGILGLIVLIIILVVVYRRIKECRKKNKQISILFDVGCCAYFVMWVFEPYAGITEFYKVFFFFVIACHCSDFIQKKESSITEKQ